ncbi:hypothetical protein [Achromobacter sp. UMC46]|uniref:hypothetical protein n=1 Tax=Achromobacter sp. UMC46 TaxID=1862319 RepID=UPI0021074EA2|nr:hypothetical protein [Achromobacter sp. UMC46]
MTMLVLLIGAGIGFLVLGGYLLVRPPPATAGQPAVLWIDKYRLRGPVGLFLILLGLALWGLAYWQLNSRFAPDAEAFTGAPRTLGSIADGLRRNSNADIQLKGDADSVMISQPVSGACATALLDDLCKKYRGTLTCIQEGNRRVIERSR